MKRNWPILFIAGLLCLFVGGYAGDAIFDPHLMNFSFRVFSIYSVAILLLIVAVVVSQGRE